MCARIRRSGVLTPLQWCSGVRSKSQTDLRCNLLFTTLVWRTCSITPHSLAVQLSGINQQCLTCRARLQRAQYGAEADLWSVGAIIFEVC